MAKCGRFEGKAVKSGVVEGSSSCRTREEGKGVFSSGLYVNKLGFKSLSDLENKKKRREWLRAC